MVNQHEPTKNAGLIGFDMISWDSMANAQISHEISRRFHDVDISRFTTRWGPLPNVYLGLLLSTKDS